MKPTSPPPVQVLTSADLIKRITSFQIGIPWPLYEFWLRHRGLNSMNVMDAFSESDPVVSKIVERGSLELLELASRVRLPTRPIDTVPSSCGMITLNLHATVRFAIQFHRPDALEWGLIYTRDHDEFPYQTSPIGLWQLALNFCRGCDLRILDVLKRHLPTDAAVRQVLFSHNFVVWNVKTAAQMRWLLTELPDLCVKSAILAVAAERGELEMVQYLYESGDCGRCDTNTFSKCYNRRHANVLAFLLEHDLADTSHEVAVAMIQDPDESIQQLVYKFAPHFQSAYEDLVRNPISIDSPAADGKLDLIKLLHERGIAKATTGAVDSAAEYGHWQVVEFLLKNRSEGCTDRAMTAAADNGHVEVIRVLHEHNAPCSAEAMNVAAARGYLEVVEFLHEHRTEGCTVAAMNEAATNGHLDVVQFLHEHRAEGCTADAVRGALRRREPRVAKFLCEHYPHVVEHDVLGYALLYGAFDLFLELRNVFPEEADAVVGDVAFDAGARTELPTLHFIINVLKRTDVAYLAMDGAASRMRKSHAQWLRAVYAITGDRSCRLSAVQNFIDHYHLHYADGHIETLSFLLSVCCEDGARELVEDAARQGRFDDSITDRLPTTLELPPLHPFLLDPRTPSWAVRDVFCGGHFSRDWSSRCK